MANTWRSVIYADAVYGNTPVDLNTDEDSTNVYATVNLNIPYNSSSATDKAKADVHMGLERKNPDETWTRVETTGLLHAVTNVACKYTFSNIAKTGRTMRVKFNLNDQIWYSEGWKR